MEEQMINNRAFTTDRLAIEAGVERDTGVLGDKANRELMTAYFLSKGTECLLGSNDDYSVKTACVFAAAVIAIDEASHYIIANKAVSNADSKDVPFHDTATRKPFMGYVSSAKEKDFMIGSRIFQRVVDVL